MKELRGGHPFELTLVLAPSQRLQHRIHEAARAAKNNEAIKRRLLGWVESLTDMNCPMMEYELGAEVSAQLRSQGIAVKERDPGDEGGHVSAPEEFTDLCYLQEAALKWALELAKNSDDNGLLRLKLWALANIMRGSRSWAVRWSARVLRKHV